jgi:hypothetical protein
VIAINPAGLSGGVFSLSINERIFIMTKDVPTSARIAELNDRLRQGDSSLGSVRMTPGLAGFDQLDQLDILEQLQSFDSFPQGDDPLWRA